MLSSVFMVFVQSATSFILSSLYGHYLFQGRAVGFMLK